MTNDFDNLDEFTGLIDEVKAAGDVPEPSPLFWNHLSARVRDAVRDEPVRGAWWMAYWRPVLVAVGSMAAVAMFVLFRPPAQPAPDANAAATSAAASAISGTDRTAAPAELVADVEVSEMWRLIEVAAPKIEMETAASVGLMPTPYATDQAIQSLSQTQLQALARLLRKEMGASE